MAHVNKRGQFFLIAALIIISVVFSLAVIYNSAASQSSDFSRTNSLAHEIQYESTQLVNQGLYNNVSEDNITVNLQNLSLIYSKSNPSYNITVIYGNYPSNIMFSYMQYLNGNGFINPASRPISNDNVSLSLNNINYSFKVRRGHNIFVIIQKEDHDERYIATA